MDREARVPSYGAARFRVLEGPLHFEPAAPTRRKDWPDMLLGILLTIHILVCIALIAVVLLQRSEGGALGMGGGPTGFMTARGAGDLLTRTTWILFGVFLVLSVALTLLAGRERGVSSVTDRLTIDSLDPNALNKAPTPTAPAPAGEAAPAPLTAPTPTTGLATPAQQPGGAAENPATTDPLQ